LGLLFALLLSGAIVRASGASAACGGFPLCDGQLWPRHPLGQIHMLHRALALTVAIVLIAFSVRIARAANAGRGVRIASAAAAALALVQAWIGAQGVLHGFPPLLAGLHVATASAVWSATVIAAVLIARTPQGLASSDQPRPDASDSSRPRWLGWLMLTKPAILLLLLFTTLAGMVVGGGRWPDGPMLAWTMLGGALTAGGASALNQYTDRGSDALMARTRRRPIPSGQVRPREALLFGMGLAAGGVVLLATRVNLLSAGLAAAGAVYYVVLYGLALKRTTPQNIVIGGGAGAIPVLVGWAAVTGRVSMAGFLLFLLVFFWTPAHFWALALVRQADYRRAGIPMLPVVVGEPDTRTQILLYAVQVVTLTLMIGAVTREGWFYFASTLALGVLLLGHALLLWRRGSAQRAWRMYRYSSLYLALYFAFLMVSTLTR
ncbi:MAG TPA: heme o synthase, partial [Anaerolineales bacterium]|nr:heme o synthase [Anaerolineales bacterium]